MSCHVMERLCDLFQTGGFSSPGFDKVLLRVAGEYKIIICSQDQTNAKVASWYWLNKKNISLKKKTFTSQMAGKAEMAIQQTGLIAFNIISIPSS